MAYLSIVLVVSFPCNIRGTVSAPEQQKLSILLQLYGFTWVLLVFSTAILRSAEIGSTYFITAWNVCALLGCIVALVEGMSSIGGFEAETEVGSEHHAYVEGTQYQAISTEEDADDQQSSHRIEEDHEPTETTPLVSREPLPPCQEQSVMGWWILQLLLVVPLPVILVSHIVVAILGATCQTLTDGNSPALSKSGSNVLFKVGLFTMYFLLRSSIQPCFTLRSPTRIAHIPIQHQHSSGAHPSRVCHLRTLDHIYLGRFPVLTSSTAQNLFRPNRELNYVRDRDRTREDSAHWTQAILGQPYHTGAPIGIRQVCGMLQRPGQTRPADVRMGSRCGDGTLAWRNEHAQRWHRDTMGILPGESYRIAQREDYRSGSKHAVLHPRVHQPTHFRIQRRRGWRQGSPEGL